jgi:hypothetical protein
MRCPWYLAHVDRCLLEVVRQKFLIEQAQNSVRSSMRIEEGWGKVMRIDLGFVVYTEAEIQLNPKSWFPAPRLRGGRACGDDEKFRETLIKSSVRGELVEP